MSETPQQEKLLVGLREAARLLDCSYWTLVSWKAQGKLRTVKLGALVKVPVEEIARLARGGSEE
jgi:excisionase family DNA binding protein